MHETIGIYIKRSSFHSSDSFAPECTMLFHLLCFNISFGNPFELRYNKRNVFRISFDWTGILEMYETSYPLNGCCKSPPFKLNSFDIHSTLRSIYPDWNYHLDSKKLIRLMNPIKKIQLWYLNYDWLTVNS